MRKTISILDEDYKKWIQELKTRYRSSQIKAAVKVNQEVLKYYWNLGRDIVEMRIEDRWGEKIINTLSADLKREIPEASGLSQSNLYYAKRFYLLYSRYFEKLRILSESETTSKNNEQVVEKLKACREVSDNDGFVILPQLVVKLQNELFSVPWGHHRFIMISAKTLRRRHCFMFMKL
jgi:hypothetical protein